MKRLTWGLAFLFFLSLVFLFVTFFWGSKRDSNEGSPLNKTASLLGEGLSSSFLKSHPFPPLTIPILGYHQFDLNPQNKYTIAPEAFRRQMEYLTKNGYNVIPLKDLVDYCSQAKSTLPPKSVVITIDDGYKSVYTYAFPILKEYRFPATLFVYINYIGSNKKALSWRELREMLEAGIDIQSHTKSHSNLLFLDKESPEVYVERLRREFLESKQILEKYLGKTIKYLAYPYGIYNRQIEEMAIKCGYEAMVTTNRKPNTKESNRFRLSRYLIYKEDSMQRFIDKLEALPLKIGKHFPENGSIVSSPAPLIYADIQDSGVKSVKMEIGEKKVPSKFDPFTQRISFKPSTPLKETAHIVTISARDTKTNRFKQTSWLFVINSKAWRG